MIAGKIKKKYVFMLVLIVVYSFVLINIVQAVGEGTAEPGTDANPLVSQDYVDTKTNENASKINALTEENKTLKANLDKMTSNVDSMMKELNDIKQNSLKYKLVVFNAGQKVVLGSGTEFILRSGKLTAIASKTGGLSDLILGKDLGTGTNIAANHLIVIFTDDGRGFTSVNQSRVMIKGSYTLK